MRSLIQTTALLALLVSSTQAGQQIQIDDGQLKAGDLATREKLSAQLAIIQSDPLALDDALYYGEMRAKLCKTCHGPDGNAQREGVPSIAGQNPVYLVDQFNRYADARRVDYWMSNLSKHFNEQDKVRLAVYYAQQPIKAAADGDPALLPQGKQLYQSHCAECHGTDGNGSAGYARLAGQRADYTAKMLREFRSASGKRYNPWMYGRAQLLRNEQEIEAVAAYLSHLQ